MKEKLYVVDNGDPSGDRMNIAIFDNEETVKEFCKKQNETLDKWVSGNYSYETYIYDKKKQMWVNQDM